MHQGMTNAAPLPVGVYRQRPEPQRRLTVDGGPAADHVSDYSAALFGDDRELGDDVTIGTERFDQNGFGRGGFARSGKGGGVQGEDGALVAE
jgi:hypothetical protein